MEDVLYQNLVAEELWNVDVSVRSGEHTKRQGERCWHIVCLELLSLEAVELECVASGLCDVETVLGRVDVVEVEEVAQWVDRSKNIDLWVFAGLVADSDQLVANTVGSVHVSIGTIADGARQGSAVDDRLNRAWDWECLVAERSGERNCPVLHLTRSWVEASNSVDQDVLIPDKLPCWVLTQIANTAERRRHRVECEFAFLDGRRDGAAHKERSCKKSKHRDSLQQF